MLRNFGSIRSGLTRFVALGCVSAGLGLACSTLPAGTAQADSFNNTGLSWVYSWDGCQIESGPVFDAHHSPYWVYAGGWIGNCNRAHSYFAVTVREWVKNPQTNVVTEVQAIGRTFYNGSSLPGILETSPECGQGLEWLSGVYVQDDDGSSGWKYSNDGNWAYAPGSC